MCQGMGGPTNSWVSSRSCVHTGWCVRSSGLEALVDGGAHWMGGCWGAEPRGLGGECDVWLVPLPPQTTSQSAWVQRSLSIDPAFPPRTRAFLCGSPTPPLPSDLPGSYPHPPLPTLLCLLHPAVLKLISSDSQEPVWKKKKKKRKKNQY